MHEFLVHTDGLTVGYRGVPLIRDITLQVRRGEILTLIGPNGAGKSTILKSIIRQLMPLGGTVYLDGRDMSGMHERAIAQRLSVLMTDRSRPELMTCGEVAAAGRYPYTGRLGILSAADRAKVHEAMALVHAEALYDRSFDEISDGQRQRVLLARAICQEPEVIVLDEPTSFLDIRYKAELLTILKRLVREKQIALILSLHEIDLAQKISDRIVCIRSHAVARCGTREEIFSGGYLERLYGMTAGSFDEHYGGIELAAVPGPPRVFVIGGGGRGIPGCRRLPGRGRRFLRRRADRGLRHGPAVRRVIQSLKSDPMILFRGAVQRRGGDPHAAQDLIHLMVGHRVLHAGRRLLLVEFLQDAVHGVIGTFAWHR